MQDAIDALRTAATELEAAAPALPHDLRERAGALLADARSLIETMRTRDEGAETPAQPG